MAKDLVIESNRNRESWEGLPCQNWWKQIKYIKYEVCSSDNEYVTYSVSLSDSSAVEVRCCLCTSTWICFNKDGRKPVVFVEEAPPLFEGDPLTLIDGDEGESLPESSVVVAPSNKEFRSTLSSLWRTESLSLLSLVVLAFCCVMIVGEDSSLDCVPSSASSSFVIILSVSVDSSTVSELILTSRLVVSEAFFSSTQVVSAALFPSRLAVSEAVSPSSSSALLASLDACSLSCLRCVEEGGSCVEMRREKRGEHVEKFPKSMSVSSSSSSSSSETKWLYLSSRATEGNQC